MDLQTVPASVEARERLDEPAPAAAAAAAGFGLLPAAHALGEAPAWPAERSSKADPDATEAITRRMLGMADASAAILALLAVVSDAVAARPAMVLLSFLLVVVHKLAGLYDYDALLLRRPTLDDLPKLLHLGSAYALLVGVGGHLLNLHLAVPRLVVLWLATVVLTAVLRTLARAASGRIAPPERCVVIGSAEDVERVSQKLDGHRRRVRIVASIGIDADNLLPVADVEALRELVALHRAHRLVIVPMDSADNDHVIRMAKLAGVRVSVMPRGLNAVGPSAKFEQIDGLALLGVRRLGLSRSAKGAKRLFDLVLGSLILLAVSPVLALFAVAIRLDSAGPVFFRQVRIGQDGRPLRIWKFRTMVPDAEQRKADLWVLNEAGDGMFKIAHDPRVTRVGRILRKTSLDELPQLFNVLCGEMSLVGPRPLVVDEDRRVEGPLRARLHLTPGMTGPWQVLGSRVPMQEMIGMDYSYVANWSVWEDVKLLLRTIPHVIARRGC